MKIKNALKAKLWPAGSTSPLNYIGFVLLLFIAVVVGSCKKEILSPKNNLPPSSNVNIGIIAYGDFLKEINVNSLGLLKPKLNYASPKNKLLSIANGNEFGNLAVYTDSVERIIHEGDTSYVFKMALTSKRAITFRNLTIHKNNGKTTAFIATYTPSREWINARKLGRKIDFKGDMAFTELNLEGLNLTQALSFDNSLGSNGKVMSSPGNKKMLTQQICFLYAIYTTTPYPCSYGGHMPWDEICPWNFGGDVPAGDYAAGYTTKVTYFEACETITTPDTGSGGSGGGGGTSPNPPGDYDPCDGGGDVPVAMNSNQVNKSLRLSLLPPPPTDCDDGTLPPLPPLPVSMLDDVQLQQAMTITQNAIHAIEEEMMMEGDGALTTSEENALAMAVIQQHEDEFYSNLSEFTTALTLGPGDDENPFWNKIKGYLRRVLAIDRPHNAQEAEEIVRTFERIKPTADGIRRVYEYQRTAFSFIPGYSAIDAMIMEQNYSSAAVNLSFDLFGGALLKGIGSNIVRIGEKLSVKTFELGLKYPNIANKLRSFKISEFNIIKQSNTEKVIIIGESMGERILPAKDVFKKIFKNAETFQPSPEAEAEFAEKIQEIMRLHGRDRLTDAEMRLTKVFRENVNWMTEKIDNGYNVIDIGPKVPNSIKSPSYAMERSFIYKK